MMMLVFFACTDDITGPGISDTTSTQTTETTDPEDTDPSDPGAAVELTDVQVREATVLLLDCYDSSDVQQDADVPGSGVTYDPYEDVITFTDHDISGYSFNTSGWQSISGTIQVNGGGSLLFDISLKGSAEYSIQFAIDLTSMFNTVSVTVNGKDYMVQLRDENGGIPDNCHITYDTRTNTVINTPRWPDENQRVSVPSDYVYSTASKEDAYATSSASGSFSYSSNYPFSVSSNADVNSSGGGNAELSVYSMADAGGINFSGDMDYQVFGNAYHTVYFSASSDNPETTRISVTFNVTAGGVLSYTTNDYAATFTSLAATSRLSRMGWYDNGEGDISWSDVELIDGPDWSDTSGYAVVGFTDRAVGNATGIFLGDVSSPDVANASVAGTETLTGEILPDAEMFCLTLNLWARSIIEFTGLHTDDEGSGIATCQAATMSYTYTAVDPDHPGADITLNFYIPDF